MILNLTPAPGDELVRLVNPQGASELNVDGRSFVADHRGEFHVQKKYVTPETLTIAGFVVKPLTKAEGLQDVGRAIGALPACPEKGPLTAVLAASVTHD